MNVGGIIVSGAVGAGVVYVWIWRRYRYVFAHWRHQHDKATFERKLRELRETASAPKTFRVAGAGDAELVAKLDGVRADEGALLAAGFTLLGDVVETSTHGTPAIRRWLVDESGSVGAGLGVVGDGNAWLSLNTARGGEVYATSRATRHQRLAQPQFLHYQSLPPELSLAELIRRHAAFAGLDGADRIASCADVVAQLERTHTRVLEWRAAQPPDVLLDADLRGLLGEHYERVGKIWARRLRDELPRATARY